MKQTNKYQEQQQKRIKGHNNNDFCIKSSQEKMRNREGRNFSVLSQFHKSYL